MLIALGVPRMQSYWIFTSTYEVGTIIIPIVLGGYKV